MNIQNYLIRLKNELDHIQNTKECTYDTRSIQEAKDKENKNKKYNRIEFLKQEIEKYSKL